MHRLRTRKARRAFTLVELLVVVLILAILMAVALPLYLGAIRNSEKGAARANMQTIANANQSHKLQTGAYAATITDLYGTDTDLGSGITGPGNPARTYSLVAAGTSCDHDGDGTGGTANVAVPTGSFGVQSSVTTDGCFIPGVSPR
jgi:type IV pilus assembly protein PilA